MHAIIRLTVGRVIPNLQASWVKLGRQGALQMLKAGANDLGGVLINESITRAAGAAHGQSWAAHHIAQAIQNLGRVPQQRNTRYQTVCAAHPVDAELQRIQWITQTPAGRRATNKLISSA